MGIKTNPRAAQSSLGLLSEKPPHHMGIKTSFQHPELLEIHSEKPPHHTGIKTSKLG